MPIGYMGDYPPKMNGNGRQEVQMGAGSHGGTVIRIFVKFGMTAHKQVALLPIPKEILVLGLVAWWVMYGNGVPPHIIVIRSIEGATINYGRFIGKGQRLDHLILPRNAKIKWDFVWSLINKFLNGANYQVAFDTGL